MVTVSVFLLAFHEKLKHCKSGIENSNRRKCVYAREWVCIVSLIRSLVLQVVADFFSLLFCHVVVATMAVAIVHSECLSEREGISTLFY